MIQNGYQVVKSYRHDLCVQLRPDRVCVLNLEIVTEAVCSVCFGHHVSQRSPRN